MKIVWTSRERPVEYSILTWFAQQTGSIYPCWPVVRCCSICGCLQCKGTNVLILWVHSAPRLDILFSGLGLVKILMDWGIVVLSAAKSWHLCIYSKCFRLVKLWLLRVWQCWYVWIWQRASSKPLNINFWQCVLVITAHNEWWSKLNDTSLCDVFILGFILFM